MQAGLAAAAGASLGSPSAAGEDMARREIPASGERLPVIGLGTSDEFGSLPADGGTELAAVLRTLHAHGGTLVDTAPGYGDAESVLGQLLGELDLTEDTFLSTKVRTRGAQNGRRSLERSQALLGKRPLDLAMVHSLYDADTQLGVLQAWKDEGHVRYIGITTSRARDFDRMEALVRSRPMDFVQLNYSPMEPGAAERVIPAAQDAGIAVMVNRAFGNGSYFRRIGDRPLPAWAAEFDCESWAQLSLKYILGNPQVTCVLAATSNPRHMADNAAAGVGGLPSAARRRDIERLVQSL